MERKVAHRVLLVAKLGAEFSTIKDQIIQQPATALLHEDARVGIVGLRGQLEDAVLDRGGLRIGPMDGTEFAEGIGDVEDQVPNLSEKNIGANEVELALGALVLVGLEKANAGGLEARSCFEDGHRGRVSDDLGVVVNLDGAGDQVCAGGDVDHRWSGRCANTLVADAAIAVGDGSTDCGGIVGDWEDLVATGAWEM